MAGSFEAAAAAGLFGVYADLAYNCYSATNSSPQTTELFAKDRQDSLMKYVYMGHAQALGIGLTAAIYTKRASPLIGACTVGLIMHLMYAHALKAGQAKAPPKGASKLGSS